MLEKKTGYTSKSSDYLRLLRFCGQANADPREPNHNIVRLLNRLIDVEEPLTPLIPQLYKKSIETNTYTQLEPKVQKLLRHNSMSIVGSQLVNDQHLGRVIESFAKYRVPLVLLKGTAFSNYLYEGDAPRPGVDNDILVKKRDFEKGCEILSESMEALILSERRKATHRRLFERIFVSKNTHGKTIELHWGLTNPHIFKISEEALWENSEEHPYYGSDLVRVLSPEHTLIHLAVHSFRDLDFCSHSLLDAHKLVSLRPIDEVRIVQDSGLWGAKAVLYHFLQSMGEVMKTNVSPSLLEQTRPGTLRERIQIYCLETASTHDSPSKIQARANQLACQVMFPDKLIYPLKFHAHYLSLRAMDYFSS